MYGVRKVWRQMQREGFHVARCTVERLMRVMGLQGVIRGKRVRTTVPNSQSPRPPDHVPHQFRGSVQSICPQQAFSRIWGVSDFTYVATRKGHVPQMERVAFVIDAYARRIVGWRASFLKP